MKKEMKDTFSFQSVILNSHRKIVFNIKGIKMKLLEKNNYAFKAQLDNLEKLYSIKCVLLENDTDPDELFHKIKTEHLTPLFGTTDNELMTGEVDDNSVYLSMVFRMEGVFFEAGYMINIMTGEIEFKMDRPMICVKDFVMLADMDTCLVELIKEKMKTDKHLVLIDDARFDSYFSEKFLSTFIDYLGYIEELVSVDKCKDCIYWYQYRLSGFCKELYVRNRCNL